MSKKLLNLDSCDALNPSFSCFRVPRTDLAPGEEDAWAVYTSGQNSSVSIIKTANSRDGGVLVSDVVTVQFPVVCTAAFLVENTDNQPVGVAVCLFGGEVQLILLAKLLKVLGGRYTEKSSRKRHASPNSQQKRKKAADSAIQVEVIDLDDDDSEGGKDAEVMDTSLTSHPQARLHTGNSDIFTSLLKEDKDRVDSQCSVHDDSSNCPALKGGVVECKVVAVCWFNLPKYLTVLSAVQISDSVLFQLQNQSTTGNIALYVYRVDGDVEVPTISFSTSHSIPNSELKMGIANEWQYLPLPLPILIACHEEGKVTRNSSRLCMLSKEFYTQLFPPALSLAKVPLLLIGLPNGNVIYAPLTDIHLSQQDIFMGPLCSVEQAVSGLCSFGLHENTSACNSLAVVGRSGKILFCVPGKAASNGPRFELIHSGSPVFSTCQLSPFAVSLTGMQHARVVDMRPLLPNLIHTVQESTQLVPLLTKAVRGTRLDVPGAVVTVPVVGDSRHVLVLTVDGGLFLVSTVSENTCISDTSGAGQGLHNSLDKLRHLESYSEKVRKEVEEIETSIGEMNTALHVFHILETERRNSIFLVDSVLPIESGLSTSAQLKITFKYTGARTLGEGWSVLISAVPHTQGLHTMPIVSEDSCLFSSPLSERGCFLSSPIVRMEPHSVSFFYLEVPACYVYQPLLFTCAVHFCGKDTGGDDQRFALSHTVCSKVMDVLDFLRDVPPSYVTCSTAVHQSLSSLPNVSKQRIWNLDPVTEHSISQVYSKALISQYLASSSSNIPDDTHLLAAFLQVVLGSGGDLLNQISRDCVSVRELLPDRETVSVSVEALKNGECEAVQILISSTSYNAATATADSLADKMLTTQTDVPFKEAKKKLFENLNLKKKHILGMLRDLRIKAFRLEQEFALSMLKDIVSEIKVLNEGILHAKTHFS